MIPGRLGVTIKQIRTKRKPEMIQAALAEAVGVHRISTAQIEAGTEVPSICALGKLARALGVMPTRLPE
jgi:transcriptional regulator with XRE-family HTH domain